MWCKIQPLFTLLPLNFLYLLSHKRLRKSRKKRISLIFSVETLNHLRSKTHRVTLNKDQGYPYDAGQHVQYKL